MSEMTVEQAKYCITHSYCDMNCDLFKKCFYGTGRNDFCKIAKDMTIKAFEENEKLKEEYKLQNDYLMRISKEYDDMREISNELDEELRTEKSQMSSVEVLEWLKSEKVENVFHSKNLWNIFIVHTPQEIVDKIQEYEKSKSEPVRNSDEFKVGDKVLYKGKIFVVESIDGKDEIGLVYESGLYLSNYVKESELEHVEPPKEEFKSLYNQEPIEKNNLYKIGQYTNYNGQDFLIKYIDEKSKKLYLEGLGWITYGKEEPQVEWVCECYCDVNIFYCRDEEFAIRWCERKSKEIGTESYYRKVCRRKES